jgi:hypothetical protein
LNLAEIIYWIGSGIVILVLLEALISMLKPIVEFRRTKQLMNLSAKKLQRELELVPVSSATPGSNRAWRGYRRFILEEKVAETDDICSFLIRPVDGEALPSYEPGQHLGFQFRIPGQTKLTTRNYSLSCAPGDPQRYKITVKRIPSPPDQPSAPPGQGSSYLHDSISIGDLLEVSSPAGRFVLDRQDPRPAVFVAGGIGITPLLSMLETICTENINRKCFFIHAVRNRDEHVFRDHIEQLITNRSNLDLHVFYSHQEEGQDFTTTDPAYHEGFLDVERLVQITGGGDLQYYICGPPPMMSAIVPALEESGVSSDSILMEAFGPASTRKNPSVDSTAATETPTNIEKWTLHFNRSNQTILWNGSNSILELAEKSGIHIDSSCRSGNCGTCEVPLLEGKIEYDEEPEVDISQGHCLTCVARPTSNIVLNV